VLDTLCGEKALLRIGQKDKKPILGDSWGPKPKKQGKT
jgi:hypothetical protein